MPTLKTSLNAYNSVGVAQSSFQTMCSKKSAMLYIYVRDLVMNFLPRWLYFYRNVPH